MLTLSWWTKPPRISILTVGWAIVILILSALPGRDLPKIDLFQADKIAHVLVYLVLFILLMYWFSAVELKTAWVKAFVIVVLYGMAMEFMQDTFFPERFFDWADAVANAVGAGLGIVIFRYIR